MTHYTYHQPIHAFDWNAEPSRPLSRADVWTLMVNGCTAGDIAAAGHVSELAARGMMLDAARGADRARLSFHHGNAQSRP